MAHRLKTCSFTESPKRCSKSCYTKTITLVFGQYTSWTPLAPSSMVHQVPAHFSRWCTLVFHFTSHVFLIHTVLLAFLGHLPPLISYKSLHQPYFRFPLILCSCSMYLELWLTPFISYTPLFQAAPRNTLLPSSSGMLQHLRFTYVTNGTL